MADAPRRRRTLNEPDHIVAEQAQQALQDGRILQQISLAAIDMDHMPRDRMMVDAGELEELKSSI